MGAPYDPANGLQHIGGATFSTNPLIGGATETTHMYIGGVVGPVAGGGVSPPVNSVAPVITGTAQVGQTLNVSNGTWSNSPTGFTYQWNGNGSPIGGATANSYVPVTGDIGHTLTCAVTASNSGGAGTPATSAATAAVIAAGSGIGSVPINFANLADGTNPVVQSGDSSAWNYGRVSTSLPSNTWATNGQQSFPNGVDAELIATIGGDDPSAGTLGVQICLGASRTGAASAALFNMDDVGFFRQLAAGGGSVTASSTDASGDGFQYKLKRLGSVMHYAYRLGTSGAWTDVGTQTGVPTTALWPCIGFGGGGGAVIAVNNVRIQDPTT